MDKPQKLKNLELKELHDFQEKSEYLISQFGQLYIELHPVPVLCLAKYSILQKHHQLQNQYLL